MCVQIEVCFLLFLVGYYYVKRLVRQGRSVAITDSSFEIMLQKFASNNKERNNTK